MEFNIFGIMRNRCARADSVDEAGGHPRAPRGLGCSPQFIQRFSNGFFHCEASYGYASTVREHVRGAE